MTALEFGYSIHQIAPKLKPNAFRLTKNMDDANDLVQETLYKALSNRDKFSDGTNLKAWMFTIMKNTFITSYQRMMRRNTFIDTTDNLHYLNTSRFEENKALSKFTLKDINDAIIQVNEIYREPFLMYYKGFKYHEIAERLEIPIGTVKNRIHIARKELKGLLKVYQK